MIRRERIGGVEVVRLDAPPLNLLGSGMVAALTSTFAGLAAQPPRAVVLFCTGGGADVREMSGFTAATARAFITALHEACAAIRAVDAPVIAAIDGPCPGAHLEVAAVCDIRIASERARFSMPEIRVGIPSVIDAWWITRICGLGAASELFFRGEFVDAAEARRIGLVERVLPASSFEAAVFEYAGEIAAFSPVALAAQKRVLRDWTDGEYRRAAAASIERFVAAIEAGEFNEGMRAMLEKRPAVFGDGRNDG